MSIHFHQLVVKEVRRETADCVSVSFSIPGEIKSDFLFKQGQSLTMRATIDGEEIRRTYSICSSPLDQEWRVAIKKVEGGLFSSFINKQLKKGDTLDVMPPVGKFYVDLDPLNAKNYLALAAGSGITPILSIIKTTLRTEPNASFTLVFGNRSRSSIIFFEELEGLKNKYLERFNFINILSRERTDAPINFGRINDEKLIELGRLFDYSSFHDIFICGPEEMIFTAMDFLEERGVEKKKIHFELFTTPGVVGSRQSAVGSQQSAVSSQQSAVSSQQSAVSSQQPAVSTGPVSKITVKLDGRAFDFVLALSSNMTLLDAALKEGADLPFACKGGVCCTCKARLLQGEVSMDVHWGLEEEEVKQGYILTCQSHPRTENVVVDFDIK